MADSQFIITLFLWNKNTNRKKDVHTTGGGRAARWRARLCMRWEDPLLAPDIKRWKRGNNLGKTGVD